MRYLLPVLLLCSVYVANATNYYFSASSGDDSRSAIAAQQPFTPWRTLAKCNAMSAMFNPGDSILFKRGDRFEGAIVITRSGNAGQPIVYAAYGEGAKPVISGFTTVTPWSSLGGNIWESTIGAGSMVNMLLINNEQKPIGRFPNSSAPNKGYLILESYVGNTQITDNELAGFPDWTGGDVVIRKNRWVIDRNYITRHTGNTIQYNSGSPNYAASGYGYFIQNHPKTLDAHGEWYYSLNEKKLGLYFSSGNPGTAAIQVSTINNLVSINSQTDIVIRNLHFTGANESALQVHNGQRVSIQDCDISFSGINAITATNFQQLVIENNVISQTNNIAIHQENCFNSIIRNNRISGTGMIAGMGKNDSGAYEAIMLTGDNHLIEGNVIEFTGYIPITFRGNSNIIRNNFINHFALVKDDGSGIYTWNNVPNAPLVFGSKIISNIILNGKGAGEGTDNPGYVAANGIYMDDNSANVEITGNTVANNALHGIYIHNAHEITITNNTLFNNGSQLALVRDGIASYSAVRNIVMQNNIFLSKEVAQPVAEFKTHENDINQFGSFDNNYYARPVNDNFTINTSFFNGAHVNKSLNLDDWKQQYAKDISSKASPVNLTSGDQIRFEYNEGNTTKTVALDQPYVDVRSNAYTGSIKLEPFSSLILLPKQLSSPVNGLCPETGSILREQWDNITGNDIAQIPKTATPSSTSKISRFETVQLGDNYAARIRGYICAPQTGAYTFFLSGDDAAELWLSTNDQPENRKKIAGIISYTNYNEWDKFPGQTSAKINLVAGQRYYVELLHKEGGGGDHVTVGWQMPDAVKELPIPGSRLSPFGASLQPPVPQPLPEIACNSTGSILREWWLNVTGNTIAAIPVGTSPTGNAQINRLQTASLGDNYGERIRGYLCVPQTGNYQFFISGDDAVELWLSTDDQPSGKKKLAEIAGFTLVNEWSKYASQNSAPVFLKTGQRYYIEVLHKEGGGDDHLTVGWQLPDGNREFPLPGSSLSPFAVAPLMEAPACTATGSITREQWNNITGNDIVNIPLTKPASSTGQLISLQTNEVGDNYGARIRGYICPPQTGNYTFFISGDDAAECWLSSDEQPANSRKIASLLSYTGVQDYGKYASQTSAAIYLQAGKKYYIEVLHKEGGGGDHLSVGWQLPDGVKQLAIPGDRLSPFALAPAILPQLCVAEGRIQLEQWTNVAGVTIADIPVNQVPEKTGYLTTLQTYHMGDRYGLRLRGYLCAPLDGNYTISVAGDDAVECWLSTDESPNNKVRIVNLLSYTSFQDWFRSPSQTSAPVYLKAGKRYYLEVLQKEGDGGDHISIGWQLPDKKQEFPIGPDRLSPYVSSTGMSTTSSVQQGNALTELRLAANAELKAYPSPFKSSAIILVNPSTSGEVKLEVYDLHGKLVNKLFSGRMEAGSSRSFMFQPENIANGVYIIRLFTGGKVLNQKVTYSK